MTVEIPLRDEFSSATGQFPYYDAYDLAQRDQLYSQKHVDIRSFNPDVTFARPMASLNPLSMTSLDADTMSVLEGSYVIREGETWTVGTVTKQADRNNWYGISLSCNTGTTTTASTVPKTAPEIGLEVVDISALEDSDLISVALPALPLANLTTASCFIDFTSNADADFTVGPTDSIAFSASTVALVAGNSELRFPISLLTTIDKSQITGVRFRIQATGSCTFRCLAVRAVSADWTYAPLDLNTMTGQVKAPVSPNGAAAASWTFPTATAPITPSEWPVLYRSSAISGTADPRPIDVRASVVFNTGTCLNATGSNYNVIAVRCRELGLDEYTQLDLDGGTFTQATLDALGNQPDYGTALFDNRTQADLDIEIQESLDDDTQFSLERVQDFLSAAYIEFKLQWTASATTLSIKNADNQGYSFTPPTLALNTNYIVMIDLVDALAQARIYKLDAQGNIDRSAVIYDTSAIVDDQLIHRRKGRFGWYSRLRDGDALIENIRIRSANFSEYKSGRFLSDTPVDGARLSVQASPERELLTSLAPGQWGGEQALDGSKSNSGHAFKVQTDSPLEGVQTNTFYIDNFADTTISFDVIFPSDALNAGAGLEAILVGELGRIVSLYLPPIIPDRWQHMKINLGLIEDKVQAGPYKLILAQSTAAVAATWYLDHLSITTRVLAWEGRGKVTDAWGMNQQDWIPFRNLLNSETDGILFAERGRTMQIRARALRQDASISNIKIIPKYAQLGRFVWGELDIDNPETPGSVISVSGRTISCNGFQPFFFGPQAVIAGDSITFIGPIVGHLWTFGDGTFDYGENVSHTYETAGTYPVTLTVINYYGKRASITTNATVT